jgi:multidrug efflux pump
MNISRFFIDRPIFAAVLSILTVVLGVISYRSLPVSQYPDVVPPTIVVQASYPGAPPEVIADTVATPIEQEVNGVENMLYMSSQSTTDGQMTLTITFRLGTNLDTAQVLVQNRVAVAEPRLPEDVRRIGVTTRKSSPDLLMVVHLLSPSNRYDQLYIGNFALIQVSDALRRIDGVGDVNLFGLREYSMRVWLDPGRLASRSIATSDVVAALREQNIQVASGTVGQPPVPAGHAFQIPVTTLGRLRDPEEFENIVVKTGSDGRITRVRDVARIELAARDYSVNSYLDNQPAVAMAIAQLPGSNALATADAVEHRMQELSRTFPEGLTYKIVYNPTIFVRESITEVLHTLFEAIGLVVLVVLVFLQTWRASLIPLLAIPVSLVGTFAAMAAFGFSLNMLSLFGLVLAIGIVVDDAIVVVENVERHIAEGLAPREAAHRAMEEVTGAVIAIAFGLSAVFVPTAFLGGIAGQFYRQFALTIAVATVLSAFNSLTLSPAMCALLLQPHGAQKDWLGRQWDRLFGRFFAGFNRIFERTSHRYSDLVGRLVRRPSAPLVVYLALLVLTFVGFRIIPTGFIPAQDKGYLIVAIQLPDGASLARTDAVVRRAGEIVLATPGVQYAVAFAGFSGATRANSANAGAIFVGPKPFEERRHGPTANELLATLQQRLAEIDEANIFVIPPPPVQGLGTVGWLQAARRGSRRQGERALQELTDAYVDAARHDADVSGVFTTFRAATPQLYADIDRVKAEKLGVPLGNVFDTLQVYLGSQYVNDFNRSVARSRCAPQAEGTYRAEPEDVVRIKTRNVSGEMVPLGSVVNLEWRSGSDRIVRYNMYPPPR